MSTTAVDRPLRLGPTILTDFEVTPDHVSPHPLPAAGLLPIAGVASTPVLPTFGTPGAAGCRRMGVVLYISHWSDSTSKQVAAGTLGVHTRCLNMLRTWLLGAMVAGLYVQIPKDMDSFAWHR